MNHTRDEKEAAARVRLSELAAKFVARTAGEVSAMRAQLAKVSGGELSALADLRNLAHRACGTGATLGFEGLADCAARVEQLAEPQAPDAAVTPGVLAQLQVAIDALDAELARLEGK
jgi:HPt (histidine-containing phosphotransfer) domain-containing protein